MAAFVLPHLFFLFVLPYFSIAQTNGIVKVGATLTATEDATPWLSASGDFAFGFHRLDNKDLFLVSIWYDQVPDKTVVWYANGDNPAPRGSKIELTADRGLIFSSPQGEQTSISDPIIDVVAYGVMNDTGNFVLVNKNSEPLWQSFNQFTDTLLPTQIMGNGKFLSSRQSESNFSQGRFQLSQLNGDLGLRTVNIPGNFLNDPYYFLSTGTSSGSGSGSGPSSDTLVFNKSGYLSIFRDGQELVLSQGDDARAYDFYHRVTLNFDGVLTHSSHPKAKTGNSTGTLSWTVLWTVPANICLSTVENAGSGVCGYNRICRINIDQRPLCECPRPFSLLDPADDYRGCVPDFVQDCVNEPSSASNLYDFYVVTNIDWPTSDYDRLEPYDEVSCKEACLTDCMCAVAILRGSCWKKKLPLSNGRLDTSLNSKAFIKFKKTNSSSQNPALPVPDRNNQNGLVILLSAFLGTSVFVNFILISVKCLGFLLIYRNKLTTIGKAESVVERNLRCYTFKELLDATEEFKEELGRGSFGIVYKGVVQMGGSDIPVAVKKLDKIIQDGDKEFKTEVNVIGQTHHKNLVQLNGYCYDGPHRLLVYEFLRNGSLAGFLFGDLKLISWNQRTQIAVGIARGLVYLHDECSTQIIHCDIKPQNVLLDDCFNARISDFGLAKLLRMDQSETHTAIRGTKGYVAPEWYRNMPITVKVDVFSFGVLLLEIICCRKNVDMEIGGERAILTYWAYDCYEEGMLHALVENDAEAISDRKKLERFLIVAIWCIQEDPSLRPTMKKVMLMLEGILEVTAPPCPHPFSTMGRSSA
ncbi:G-type lectin S-receptor-like serine/threonine-protein kinase LECRK2 [Camellia lanceoleosa]|uniref:G-type lectin S-receptor-like serine/threonine-protein kinase LECRK2 n=1 Tax=Camellia lanceoleosa TaxID=1840588 RepID=A0ACC0INS5_9ERIC|nr:G-type lectin S-receptor-like serine/threonine-protein kinase LECRK2 [Camellia lanceoleosa]